MSDNSFMNMFDDPSTNDLFSPLIPNEDGYSISGGLQPSMVTSVSSSYQPLEADSIMTLGEPSPGPGKNALPGGGGGPGAGGMSYAQLGGMPNMYGSGHSSFPQQQATPQRFPPTPSYFSPGVPSGFPSQQQQQQPNHLQTPRYGHDPYRQQPPASGGGFSVFSGLSHQSNVPSSGGSVPSMNSSSNIPPWNMTGPGQGYQTRPYAPPQQGFSGMDQQQFLSHSQQQYGGPQGMQPMRPPVHGYPPQMPSHFQGSNGQYPNYPPQQQQPQQQQQQMQAGGMGQQQRLPGPPYGGQGSLPPRYSTPQNLPLNQQQQSQQQQQQQPRPMGMYPSNVQQRHPLDPFQTNMATPPKLDPNKAQPPDQHLNIPAGLGRPNPASQSMPLPSMHSVNEHYQRNQLSARQSSPAPLPSSLGQTDSGSRKSDSPAGLGPRAQVVSPVSPMVQSHPAAGQHPRMMHSGGPNVGAPPQLNGMASPTGPMMGQPQMHGTRLPVPQQFVQQPPRPAMSQAPGGGYLGGQSPQPTPGVYQNGSRMMSPSPHTAVVGPPPGSNITAEIHETQTNLNNLNRAASSGENTPEVKKKIIEANSKLENLLRHQEAANAPYPQQLPRPYHPQQGPPNLGPNRPPGPNHMPSPVGLRPTMGQQQHVPLQPHQMRPRGPGFDLPAIPRANGAGHVPPLSNSPLTQNGYQSNGLPGAEPTPSTLLHQLQSGPSSPKQSDAFGNDIASSQDSEDEGATNKYASPKKKRVRNRKSTSSANRKRKPKSDVDEPAETLVTPKKSPSKSKSRSRKKAKSPPSTFQFGKKKKKRAGSDDADDDHDATPPPSPRAPPVVEQDFDGSYIEKRRSTRVTKRRKYIDDDGDMSELDDLLPVPVEAVPAPVSLKEPESQTSDSQQYEATMADPTEAPKSYFVEPGDPEPVVVEKIMEHRMGQRPAPKVKPDDQKENGEEMGKAADESEKMIEVEEYHVKFKSYSYLHCDWKTLDELELIDKRVKQKVTRYKQKKETSVNLMEQVDDEPFDPNYTEVERVLDEKDFPDGEDLSKRKTYFLCKWMGLPYDECTWEVEEDSDGIKIAEFRARQIPPPPAERKRIPRPVRNAWKQMDKGMIYKGGNTIRDYQLEGVNWLLFCWHNKQNCILADEMGLGKTVQSTVFLEHIRRYGIRGPFLIVVPLSTLGNWSREVETWTDMNGICYHGGSNTREIIREYEFYYRNDKGQRLAGIHKFNIFITTYEILLSDIYELKDIEWRAVVIDEAHRLKNKNCKLLEGLKLLNLEHRVLLTGTPLQNNVEELFSLLHFLEPERFSNVEAFSSDFGNLKTDDQVTKLQQILKPMMLRRLKEDVEKSIAPKEETIIEVELTNMQKKWYRAILEKNFTFLQKGTSSANVPNLMNTMMELRKCCNHPYLLNGAEDSIIDEFSAQTKPPTDPQDHDLLAKALVQSSGKLVLIDKLLPKLKDGGHKVLVFSQMVRCLDILEDYLVQKRYLFERIDGRVRGPDRQAAIDRFSREDSDRFVFLLCTRAGGLGINLTAADTVIIFDSDWNPQNDLQAQARCHRIGQDKAVKVYRLITRNSYEREMFDKASLKLGLDKAVLQSGQMSGGRESFNAAQQALSKTDIEDLLKRGAYGALMDDDAAADQFCTEDIDQILQRRTQTVQLEAGEKGSTFSKASFAATGTRDDIDINDPDFWSKWAKKAEVSIDKDAFENDLIIHEPRRRLQVRRYGEEMEEEAEDASDDDYDSDDDGKGKRGRKGRKGRLGREEDMIRPGNWQRTECLRIEKAMLAWGWGRWAEILKDCNFKRNFTIKDVEILARTLVHHCCKHYCGSDDKAKPYIWNLVLQAYLADWEARKEQKAKELAGTTGEEAPDQEPSTSRQRSKTRKAAKKASTPDAEPAEPENGAHPDWENDERYDPEKLLDASFLKHMKKHSVNRMILRLKLLQNLKEEVIQDLGDLIMTDVPFQEVPLDVPGAELTDKPLDWWDEDADKCLLIGVYKHGYERYGLVRSDPKLCFLAKCGLDGAVEVPDPEKEAQKEKEKEAVSDADTADAEDAPETESTTDAETEAGDTGKRKSKATRAASKDTEEAVVVAKPPVKPGRGRRPGPKKAPVPVSDGQANFPTDPDLNTRVRRLIVAFEKRRVRAEQAEVRRLQRVEKQLQLEKEKEAKRLEQQQKKWSKREEGEFFRTVSSFGVEYGADKESYEWDKFREVSKLEKKLDKTLTEYYKCFLAMLRKVCGKKLTREEEGAAAQIEPLTEDKAHRCLQRIELLYRIRVTALRHPRLEERLKLCQPSPDLPNWWINGQHDKELLEGAAKHGLAETACNIAVDTDYTFADSIKASITAETKRPHPTSSKMESLLKREGRESPGKSSGRLEKKYSEKEDISGDGLRDKKDDQLLVEKKKSKLEEKLEKLHQSTRARKASAVEEIKEEKETPQEEPTSDAGEKEKEEEKMEDDPLEMRPLKIDDGEEHNSKEDISMAESEPVKDSTKEADVKADLSADEMKEESSTLESSTKVEQVEEGSESKVVPEPNITSDQVEAAVEEPAKVEIPVVEEAPPVEVNDVPENDPIPIPKPASPVAVGEFDTEHPGELTVAQLLARGMCAKGWPSDRIIQARLEHICYCIDNNRWPSKRQQTAMAGAITEEAPPAPPPSSAPVAMPQFPSVESFMENPDFAMLAAQGHIPGLNGVEPKRRRGRRPRVEIEAERMAQYQAAHQALQAQALQQQQALLSAANASKNRRSQQQPSTTRGGGGPGRPRHTSPPERNRPPPAHHREANKQPIVEVEGVLDLTGRGGKSKKEQPPATSTSPASSSSSVVRKESTPTKVPDKGSKLNQKVDTLLKKRKQETELEHDLFDPDARIPLINMRDGSILQGDKAPRHKDLAQFMKDHPHYLVDTSGLAAFTGFNFAESMANGAMPSKRSALDPSTSADHPTAHLSGDEHVAVINRKNGKKLTGRKAPLLKNLAEFLEANKNYDIDPSWSDGLKEQGGGSSKGESSSSKRSRKEESPPNIFGASPFGSAFPMGFPGRPMFPFPGLTGFPGMSAFPGMGMLPGVSGGDEDVASSKSESPSVKKNDPTSSGAKDSGSSSSRKRDKLEKEKNHQQQQQQQAMESMMQSQLPFIFPPASMFPGLHPLFSQGFAGLPGGFPFGLSSGMMNGFPPSGATVTEEPEATPPAAKKPSVRDRGGDRDRGDRDSQKSSTSAGRRPSDSPANFSSSSRRDSASVEKSRPSSTTAPVASSSGRSRHMKEQREKEKLSSRETDRSRRSEREKQPVAKDDSDDDGGR